MNRARAFLLSLTALCLPLVAHAESGFPADFNASTGGVRIGDQPTAVREQLDALITGWDAGEADSVAWKTDTSITRGVNRTTSTLPTETEGEEFPATDGASLFNVSRGRGPFTPASPAYTDTLSVVFGSPAVGGGVQSIYRIQYFPDPLDLRSFLETVEATYGVPHAARGDVILYGFKDGAPINKDVILRARNLKLTPEQIIRTCTNPETSPRYMPLPNRDGAAPAYIADHYTRGNWHKPRSHHEVAQITATCDAALGLQFGVDKNRNVIWLKSTVTDIRAIVADLEITKDWFAPPPPPAGTKAVPKL